jgi:hypothetical protein
MVRIDQRSRPLAGTTVIAAIDRALRAILTSAFPITNAAEDRDNRLRKAARQELSAGEIADAAFAATVSREVTVTASARRRITGAAT